MFADIEKKWGWGRPVGGCRSSVQVDNDGWSALMIAADQGDKACLLRLIDAEAAINKVDNDVWSALIRCALHATVISHASAC